MNESQDSSQQLEQRALIFPRWFIIVLGITILCIAVSQWTVPNDRAMANVLMAFVLLILGYM